MNLVTLRPRGNPSSRYSFPASSRRRICSGCLDRNSLVLVRNRYLASRARRDSKWGILFESGVTDLVRGESGLGRLGLCFLGVLVMRKEVEKERGFGNLGFKKDFAREKRREAMAIQLVRLRNTEIVISPRNLSTD